MGTWFLARVLLAQDRSDQALELLERLHAQTTPPGRLGSLIEIQALRALTLAGSGEGAGALAVLAEALTLACPRAMCGCSPMGTLLGRLVTAKRIQQTAARAVPLDCLARLLRAFNETEAVARARELGLLG